MRFEIFEHLIDRAVVRRCSRCRYGGDAQRDELFVRVEKASPHAAVRAISHEEHRCPPLLQEARSDPLSRSAPRCRTPALSRRPSRSPLGRGLPKLRSESSEFAPSAKTTTRQVISSPPALTPKTRPASSFRSSSTAMPHTYSAPASSAFSASHWSNGTRKRVGIPPFLGQLQTCEVYGHLGRAIKER